MLLQAIVVFFTLNLSARCICSDYTKNNNYPFYALNKGQGYNCIKDSTGITTITFAKEKHDFGNVKEGKRVIYYFKFKNSGDKPLIIFEAKGSCGCTVPEYPINPIAPGQSGEIKVEFNSKGKSGKQTKYVTLNANTEPSEIRLIIKANVIGNSLKN